jgi:predicted O-linked N-acetylglucosamine transferase (SPINDLY family)
MENHLLLCACLLMSVSLTDWVKTYPSQVLHSSEFYEAAIATDDTIVSNYWYLGISYLLTGREEEAQGAWMLPLAAATETEIEVYTQELIAILDREANYRSTILELENAWLLRQHLWTIAPEYLENILQVVSLANSLGRLNLELLSEWQLDELLDLVEIGSIDEALIEQTIAASIQSCLFADITLSIIKKCLHLTGDRQEEIIIRLIATSLEIFHHQKAFSFAVKLAELCREFAPEETRVFQVLIDLYSETSEYDRAIDCANFYAHLAGNRFDRLFSSYLIQKTYLTSGDWANHQVRAERHRHNVEQLIVSSSRDNIQSQNLLLASSFLSLYLGDLPEIDRPLQNQVAEIYQHNLDPIGDRCLPKQISLPKKIDVIRIGYLASTLRKHSVGWLSRWLFQYHDRQFFQIFIYCLNQNPADSFNHHWFRDKVDICHYFDSDPHEIVAQIKADEIDIIIDLDSMTSDLSCQVLAAKPAPVQATWLGLDASGIPAIDYFIVDPYVLPSEAQEYYRERLWRLPQTYLAVEGFEVGIPTLSRQDLDIPQDAVIYFSNQGGYKRHPDNIRCQLEIIKAVPNSYLLIKGKSNPQTIANLFSKICEEIGVDLERLRFLPGVPDEYTHRANLGIADIVLDTFPYNGATTTLETLWMGIPMVTQVGKQFAARNSYTFMLNAGIEEGIAWSQEEYIEWGIKLGLDPNLRSDIREKLRAGRQTAPVWNAKQFTLDMEQAYREMWAKYQSENKSTTSDRYNNN